MLTRILSVAFLALCCACSRTRPPDVVVIVLDTARPDYFSAYGHPRPTTPFLETFAKSATRYDRAYSVSSWTLPAHASLFSGTLPEYHRATQETERVAPDVPLLADRLHEAGYQTACLTNNNWISLPTGLARGFEAFRDEWDIRERMLSTGARHPTVVALRNFLEHSRKQEQPLFLFVNLSSCHMPYMPHWEEAAPFFASKEAWQKAGMELFADNGARLLERQYAGGKPLDEAELVALRALYEGTLRREDQITQAILALVDANTDPRKTLVFVLSDHGENLGDHGNLSHVFNLYDSNLRIALLARGPGFAPGAQDKQHLVQIQDLYPTILHAAGLETESSNVGLDLRAALPEQRTLVASLEHPYVTFGSFPESVQKSGVLERFDRTLAAAIGPQYKLIRGSDGLCELYDLQRDPGELTNLATQPDCLAALPPDVRNSFTQALARQSEQLAARAGAAVKGNATSDPTTRKGLKHFGYVGDER